MEMMAGGRIEKCGKGTNVGKKYSERKRKMHKSVIIQGASCKNGNNGFVTLIVLFVSIKWMAGLSFLDEWSKQVQCF